MVASLLTVIDNFTYCNVILSLRNLKKISRDTVEINNCLFFWVIDQASHCFKCTVFRQLALETIDLQKDPYFMRNHLGTYECKLCLTLHNNEGTLYYTSAHQTVGSLAGSNVLFPLEQIFFGWNVYV